MRFQVLCTLVTENIFSPVNNRFCLRHRSIIEYFWSSFSIFRISIKNIESIIRYLFLHNIYNLKTIYFSLLKSSKIFLNKLSLVIDMRSIEIAIPTLTKLSIFLCWSTNKGSPRTETPASTVSYTPDIPPWLMKSYTFGCTSK